jgi:FlaA1/EpsC-like NDP-sugar epimerase
MLDPVLEAEGLGPSAFAKAIASDFERLGPELSRQLSGASVLVVGAAGTIGAATTRQLIALAPARIEVIDIDENGLVRLARDIRSRGAGRVRIGFNPLDFASPPGLAFASAEGPFDLVLNFAAVKHVRSEKNLFTLLHMFDINVVRQLRFAAHLRSSHLARRHFVVSTDKAADPVSFMGASKRLLEALAIREGSGAGAPRTSLARFANVAWSSGSLLESYLQRYAASQALAAPRDTRRYFISARDAARICLVAQLVCPAGKVAAPKFASEGDAAELAETAAAFLRGHGRRPVFVDSPERAAMVTKRAGPDYPVILTPRDTAGEKEIEVFRGADEVAEPLDLEALDVLTPVSPPPADLELTLAQIADMVDGRRPASVAAVEAAIRLTLPGFRRTGASASLDDRI